MDGIIILIIFLVIVFLILTIAYKIRISRESYDNYRRKRYLSENSNYNEPINEMQPITSISYDNIKSINFDEIINTIEYGFSLEVVTDEEDCENQLINFLSSRFSDHVIAQGHTSKGRRIDIVIDGTYAIELIVAENEGRLMTLMDQILESKKDFECTGAIIIDINKVDLSLVKKYKNEFERLGVKTIIIKSIESDGTKFKE